MILLEYTVLDLKRIIRFISCIAGIKADVLRFAGVECFRGKQLGIKIGGIGNLILFHCLQIRCCEL